MVREIDRQICVVSSVKRMGSADFDRIKNSDIHRELSVKRSQLSASD